MLGTQNEFYKALQPVRAVGQRGLDVRLRRLAAGGAALLSTSSACRRRATARCDSAPSPSPLTRRTSGRSRRPSTSPTVSRLDVARFLDKPPTNPQVVQEFDRNTANIPSGHLQFSPRVGFNWDMTGDQVQSAPRRMGAFVGPPAYVWMSNAFQNSGLTGVNLLTCNRTAPDFNAAAIADPADRVHQRRHGELRQRGRPAAVGVPHAPDAARLARLRP